MLAQHAYEIAVACLQTPFERSEKRQKRDRKGKKAAIFTALTVQLISCTSYDASHDSIISALLKRHDTVRNDDMTGNGVIVTSCFLQWL